jgi:hypothetical protein
MLKLDLSKTLKDITKSVPPKKEVKKAASKQAKEEVAYASLGDFNRIAGLPDILTDEFVALYSATIEEVLFPYVQSRLITIKYASDYRQALMENIFGSENHLGMFQYLKEKNLEGKSDKEIVHQAETLILKGWQIRQEANQYWLINGDFVRIMEMTGRAPMFREVAMLSFDESAAHIFLEDGVASKIAALAKTLGHDADSLAATGNLDILLSRVSDNKFAGYVVNYNALRRILKKGSRFNTLVDGANMLDLYKEGFRLDSQMTFPFSEKAIFTMGPDKYIMKSVEDDINMQFLVNKYLLTAIAAKVKMELFAGTGVVSPEVIEVKELRNTFALMTKMYTYEYSTATCAETLDTVQNIRIHKKTSSYTDRVFQNVAYLAAVEGILLGNLHFGTSSFSIDSVSGKVFSNHSLDYFSRKPGGINFGQPNADKMLAVETLDMSDPDTLATIVRALPDNLKTKIASYELDLSMYPYEFLGVRNYFDMAKRMLVGES